MRERTRIAVITDAHANLPALDAALAAIGRAGCDAIYHTGDAIGIGPYPAECLDRLLNTPNMHLIMGNHDAWFAHGLPTPQPAWMSDGEVEHQRWTHAQIDPARRATVAAWPYRRREEIGGVHVAFQHYALDASGCNFGRFVAQPTAADLDPLFPDDGSAVIFYGHNHNPSDVEGRARYVNPGALGCSPAPIARYALLEGDSSGSYHLRHEAAPYDEGPLLHAFEERRVPERDFILRAFFGKGGTGADAG
jgi:predicted phosphodiesterase